MSGWRIAYKIEVSSTPGLRLFCMHASRQAGRLLLESPPSFQPRV